MSTEHELTEQELFDQYSAALAAGDEVKKNALLGDKVSLVSSDVAPAEAVNPPEQEEKVEPAAQGTAAEVTTGTTAAAPSLGESESSTEVLPATVVPPAGDKQPAQMDAATLRTELAKVTAERDDFKHRFNSNSGRITAFQKTITDLRNQIALLESAQPPVAAGKAGKDAAGKSIREHPRLAELKEADPALEGIIGDVIEDMEKRIRSETESGFKRTRDVALTQERTRFVQEQATLLRQAVPNADEVVGSEAFAFFRQNVATPAVRQLIESDHAEDGIAALQLYSSWLDSVEPRNPATAAAPAAPAKVTEEEDQARLLAESRNRRLKAKDVSSSQNSPRPVGSGDSEEELAALFETAHKAALAKAMPRR